MSQEATNEAGNIPPGDSARPQAADHRELREKHTAAFCPIWGVGAMGLFALLCIAPTIYSLYLLATAGMNAVEPALLVIGFFAFTPIVKMVALMRERKLIATGVVSKGQVVVEPPNAPKESVSCVIENRKYAFKQPAKKVLDLLCIARPTKYDGVAYCDAEGGPGAIVVIAEQRFELREIS